MTWIQTYRQNRFHLIEPRPFEVQIEDIAHALSQICRFGGHTKEFYSVAQHSVLVSGYLLNRFHDPRLSLEGHLHDAGEAYTGDATRPQKAAINEITAGGWSRFEDPICETVAKKFGVCWPPRPQVKDADNRVLHTEVRDLLPGSVEACEWVHGLPEPLPEPIVPWPCEVAERIFLDTFRSLHDRCSKAHLAGAGEP